MFDELINSYKELSTSKKREKLLFEVKSAIAVFENICTSKGIQPPDIKSKEILDLKDGKESEDDYLEALFVYVEYLKEVVATAYIGKE